MINNKILISIFFFLKMLHGFSQSFPLKLCRSVQDNNHSQTQYCEDWISVKDEKPSDCSLSFPFLLYPVIYEEFDFKEELPNNWAFNFGYAPDDDYDGGKDGHIWMGTSEDAYGNNVTASGGKLHLILKKEERPQMEPWGSGNGKKDYHFTGAALTSRFKTRGGQVKLFAKYPENNRLWVAFWKRGANTEIDVFEAWDDNIIPGPFSVSNCEVYHQMKMHVHGYNGPQHCVRGRKFNLPSDFYSSSSPNGGFHKWVCDFTDFRIDYALDDILVGYANQYYDGPFTPHSVCYTGGEGSIPDNSFGCSGLKALPDCSVWFPGTPPKPNNWPSWLPWPYIPPHCMQDNKVHKDIVFPKTQNNMDVRVSMAIRDIGNKSNGSKDIENKLLSEWSNFADIDKEIIIDRIEVWHLINCAQTLNFNYLQDFLNASGYTGFASGGKITLGSASLVNGSFVNVPPYPPNWPDYPIHLLATDEISFIGFSGGDIEINEGTYLRAEIIDCSGGTTYNERLIASAGKSSEDLVSEDEIKKIQNQKTEEYFKEHPEMRDSIAKMQDQEQYAQEILKAYKEQNLTSLTDNGSIIVYPNPTKDVINIDMVEEDFNDIIYLEITNNLGQTNRLPRTKQIDLSNYSSGMYQLKFVFSHGHIVIKSVSKI